MLSLLLAKVDHIASICSGTPPKIIVSFVSAGLQSGVFAI